MDCDIEMSCCNDRDEALRRWNSRAPASPAKSPLDIALDQYRYWRDIDTGDPTLNLLAMGAMGAAANIVAELSGLFADSNTDCSQGESVLTVGGTDELPELG